MADSIDARKWWRSMCDMCKSLRIRGRCDVMTWCSFCSDDDGFVGVVILPGRLDSAAAERECQRRGIHPGGKIVSEIELREDFDDATWSHFTSNLRRLVRRNEMEEQFGACVFRAAVDLSLLDARGLNALIDMVDEDA